MKCDRRNAEGKPCGAPALRGMNQCVMHSGRAAELGSRGGRRRTANSSESLKEFSAPKTAADLRDLLAQSIVEVRDGRLDPKLANSISYLGTGFLRALEISELEVRLVALERQRTPHGWDMPDGSSKQDHGNA
jgi:hypothetical protein